VPFTYGGDEAGDVSFAFAKGASRYFVLALVRVGHEGALDESFSELAARYRLPEQFEFSFHDVTSPRLRHGILSTLATWPVCAWVIVVDKQSLPDPFRVMPRRSFYTFFLTELTGQVPLEERQGCALILDEFDRGEKLLADLGKVFKSRGIVRGFGKVTARRSSSSRLIQCADLVAGTVLWRYARGDARYLSLIRPRLVTLLEYPAKEKPPS
jgi:hypothetical protein